MVFPRKPCPGIIGHPQGCGEQGDRAVAHRNSTAVLISAGWLCCGTVWWDMVWCGPSYLIQVWYNMVQYWNYGKVCNFCVLIELIFFAGIFFKIVRKKVLSLCLGKSFLNRGESIVATTWIFLFQMPWLPAQTALQFRAFICWHNINIYLGSLFWKKCRICMKEILKS